MGVEIFYGETISDPRATLHMFIEKIQGGPGTEMNFNKNTTKPSNSSCEHLDTGCS